MLSSFFFFFQKIEPFARSCSAAISSLQQSISTLQNSGNLKTSKVRATPPCLPHRQSGPLIYVSPLTHSSSVLASFSQVSSREVIAVAVKTKNTLEFVVKSVDTTPVL